MMYTLDFCLQSRYFRSLWYRFTKKCALFEALFEAHVRIFFTQATYLENLELLLLISFLLKSMFRKMRANSLYARLLMCLNFPAYQ